MAASIPPSKLLIFGALAAGGIWYMRAAKAGTLPRALGGRAGQGGASAPRSGSGAGSGPGAAGTPSTRNVARPLNVGDYFGTGVGRGLTGYDILNGGNNTVGAGAPSLLNSVINGISRAFGGSGVSTPVSQVLTSDGTYAPSSPVGVPNEDARSAVRAGDPYYGAGAAGNNDTPQETFRRSEYADPSYGAGQTADYGTNDTGPVTYTVDTEAARAAVRAGDPYYDGPATQIDAVPMNPASGVDYSPDTAYDPSLYAAADSFDPAYFL